MRAPLVLVLLAALAPAASAQEEQQDLAERIVREQEDVRRRAAEKVRGAPDKAAEMLEDGRSYGPSVFGDGSSSAAAPTPAAPAKRNVPGGGVPWVLIACLLPAIPLAVLVWTNWRRSHPARR